MNKQKTNKIRIQVSIVKSMIEMFFEVQSVADMFKIKLRGNKEYRGIRTEAIFDLAEINDLPDDASYAMDAEFPRRLMHFCADMIDEINKKVLAPAQDQTLQSV